MGQNLHRKPSSNPTIPKILQWRRVHLQSVKTMIKQYKTESIANHNKKKEQKKERNSNNQNDKPLKHRKVGNLFFNKDVNNTRWKFHSPNQTLPNFERWKRVNLQPIKTPINQVMTESI